MAKKWKEYERTLCSDLMEEQELDLLGFVTYGDGEGNKIYDVMKEYNNYMLIVNFDNLKSAISFKEMPWKKAYVLAECWFNQGKSVTLRHRGRNVWFNDDSWCEHVYPCSLDVVAASV